MNIDSKILPVSSGSSTKSMTWHMENIRDEEGALRKDDPRRVLESQLRMPQHRLHSGLGGSGVGGVALKVGMRSCVSQAMMLTYFLLWAMCGLSTPYQAAQRDEELTRAW